MNFNRLLIYLSLILIALSSVASTNEVRVGSVEPYVTWVNSADTRVTGYYVKYGDVLGNQTNFTDVSYTNLMDLKGCMQSQKTNFVFVTAYDQLRNESVPSTVLYFFFNTVVTNTIHAPVNVCLIDAKP